MATCYALQRCTMVICIFPTLFVGGFVTQCTLHFVTQVNSTSTQGVLLELLQVLTDFDLKITKSSRTSDGSWFMDGITCSFLLYLVAVFSAVYFIEHSLSMFIINLNVISLWSSSIVEYIHYKHRNRVFTKYSFYLNMVS